MMSGRPGVGQLPINPTAADAPTTPPEGNPAPESGDATMVRIGIVGIGFMGRNHDPKD
jgi:hypothetical protein